MKTGWVQIDGKWYYFNPVSDGTRGMMFIGRKTPRTEAGMRSGKDTEIKLP